MIEAGEVMDEWIRLMDSSGVDCSDLGTSESQESPPA